MNKSLLVVLCMALGVLLCLFLYHLLQRKTSENHLRIGVATGYAPWATVTTAGALEGFDVDIAYELGHRLGVPVSLVDMSPELLIASVKTKKLDLMVAPMAITPEREKAFIMIHYQGSSATQWPLMFLREVPPAIKTLADVATLPNPIVCVLPGTKQAEYAYSMPSITVRALDNMALLLMEIRHGKAAAALVDPDLGVRTQQENPDMTFVQIPVPPEYHSRGNGIAIHHENHKLAQDVVVAITSMKKDGFITEREHHWHIERLQ